MTERSNDEKNFIMAYNRAFDSNGNVIACGRDQTTELIRIANKIMPEIRHGDEHNGFMDVDAMHRLMKTIGGSRRSDF